MFKVWHETFEEVVGEWKKHCSRMRSVEEDLKRGEGREEDLQEKTLERKCLNLSEKEETGGSQPFAIFVD